MDPRLGHLRLAVWGIALVVLDIRGSDGIDWVPDPLGWLLVFVALWQVRRLHAAFDLAAACAGVAFAASLLDWAEPGGPVVSVVTAIAETGLVFTCCTALIAVAPAYARFANAIRWWDLGLSVALAVLALLAMGEPSVAFLALMVALADLAAFVCFLVLLWRVSARPRVSARTNPVPRA